MKRTKWVAALLACAMGLSMSTVAFAEAPAREKGEIDLDGITVMKDWCDDIPVIYIEPEVNPGTVKEGRKLAIWLSGLGGTKESLAPYLKDIAEKGYVALAFDLYQHGERDPQGRVRDEVHADTFANIRKYGWPILGQTTLDTERVVDWAIENLGVEPEFYMGGISMGGDITMTVAGIDDRLVRGAPVVTTPDWLRPGMHNLTNPGVILDPGKPDSYAQYFYNQLNPITHLDRYVDVCPMRLTLGEDDNHIPPENAERFKKKLAEISPEAAARIEINYIKATADKGANHRDVIGRKDEWWPELREWWLG